MNDYLVWKFNPVALSIGSFEVMWYGVLFSGGFLAGYFIMRHVYTVEGKNLEDLDLLLLYIIGGTVIGARLGHCLFYDPGYYLSRPWEILFVRDGGLASHGGALGVLYAIYLYLKKDKKRHPLKKDQTDFLWILDRLTMATALISCFIRFGNFLNSEIIGKPTDVSWAVIFPKKDMLPRHPTQLYESITYLLIFILVFFIYNRYKRNLARGSLFGVMLITIFGSRILFEFTKTIQENFTTGIGLNMGQLLSVPFVIFGAWLLWRAKGFYDATIPSNTPPSNPEVQSDNSGGGKKKKSKKNKRK